MRETISASEPRSFRRIFADPHPAGYRSWHTIAVVFISASCIRLALENVQTLADHDGLLLDRSERSRVLFFSPDAAAPVGIRAAVFGPNDPISGNPNTDAKLFFTAVPVVMWSAMVP